MAIVSGLELIRGAKEESEPPSIVFRGCVMDSYGLDCSSSPFERVGNTLVLHDLYLTAKDTFTFRHLLYRRLQRLSGWMIDRRAQVSQSALYGAVFK